ncbi:MAG TPA: glycosyltransferase family 4 protein [Pyrinomonadaceae bacterium]|jgi:glycosyltransferase involved in cell wall biosynthesis|nr:glycosyltransferase family 4 protein [Pyrinomonadaceae bacterium]
MTRRIILFGPLPPPHGGVSIYLKALVAHFRGPNVRAWTYTGPKPTDERVRFVSHRRLGTVGALLAEGRGARILDASHFHLEYPNPLLLPLWILLKRWLGFEWYKNVLDGSLPKRFPQFGPLDRWLLRRALHAVDQFVVVSEDLRRWLQEEMKVRQPVTVIPCLLPASPGETTNALSANTAESLEFYLAQSKRVCSIGVFFPSYGFSDVAAAVEELRKRTGKDIGLLLLDGGFVRDEKYREEVLWERDWITVLEKVPNAEIYQILKRSDVFVRAFADESYGISRIEALWSGTPVVATRAGETRGMLLYDFGDVDELISQLQAVLLYPVLEQPNPWAARYRQEAEENLQALAKLLGIEEKGNRGIGKEGQGKGTMVG